MKDRLLPSNCARKCEHVLIVRHAAVRPSFLAFPNKYAPLQRPRLLIPKCSKRDKVNGRNRARDDGLLCFSNVDFSEGLHHRVWDHPALPPHLDTHSQELHSRTPHPDGAAICTSNKSVVKESTDTQTHTQSPGQH